MLTLRSARSGSSFCDGVSRRNFLRAGCLGVAGFTLADLLRLRAEGAVAPRSANKAVIMVYLQGGPPHQDMYDLKPMAPVEVRGDYNPIRTNVPGMDICELMPMQAKIADKLAIVRNMQFRQQGHSPPELMTGELRADRPSFGSIISKLNSDAGRIHPLPPYVSLDRFVYTAFLGAAHGPYMPGEDARGIGLVDGLSLERLDDRKKLLREVDRLRRELDNPQGSFSGVDSFTRQAMEMITSDKARDAFDIELEPSSIRQKYGPLTDFLRARRLVEAGVSVVDLTVRCNDLPQNNRTGCRSDWDFHENNFMGLQSILPPFDQAVYALLTDLDERGLDKDVAVIIWGEMGRTPKINAKAGRDHWPQAGFTIVAGGGLKMGQVIGATDRHAALPTGNPYTPQNVLATAYHVLGINAATTTIPNLRGRPIYLLDDSKRIEELV
ncbi:MAG: hypothetical protein ACI9G1_000643 [Pirellulaceae bacterium]|jgi:hypothetical protein